MKNITKVSLALMTAATFGLGVVAPAANAATPYADNGIQKVLVNVNDTAAKQKIKGKYHNTKLKSGVVFHSTTQKSPFKGYVKVKKTNGAIYDVPRSALKSATQGGVQMKNNDRSIHASKGNKLKAYSVKKAGKILTERGWTSVKNVKAVPVNVYKVKKTTKAVHGTGYVYGTLHKGERVAGYETGAFSVKGQGKRWWIDAGNSLVNSGDLQYLSSYRIAL